MRKRLPPAQAAAGIVAGIERREPRVIVPGWWKAWFALRGILNPIFDARDGPPRAVPVDPARGRRPDAPMAAGLTTPATAETRGTDPCALELGAGL